MNSVTIYTDDNEIVIIPRQRPGLQLAGSSQPCDQAASPTGSIYDVPPTSNGHTKVFADNTKALAEATDRTDHAAIIDHATGLMWAVESIGDEDGDPMNHAACVKAAGELRLLGHDDWRLPTRSELAALVDDTRTDPAIDTSLFPRVKPRWHWTSTDYAGDASYAWYVLFYNGYVNYGRRNGNGFVLAVRRASQ